MSEIPEVRLKVHKIMGIFSNYCLLSCRQRDCSFPATCQSCWPSAPYRSGPLGQQGATQPWLHCSTGGMASQYSIPQWAHPGHYIIGGSSSSMDHHIWEGACQGSSHLYSSCAQSQKHSVNAPETVNNPSPPHTQDGLHMVPTHCPDLRGEVTGMASSPSAKFSEVLSQSGPYHSHAPCPA